MPYQQLSGEALKDIHDEVAFYCDEWRVIGADTKNDLVDELEARHAGQVSDDDFPLNLIAIADEMLEDLQWNSADLDSTFTELRGEEVEEFDLDPDPRILLDLRAGFAARLHGCSEWTSAVLDSVRTVIVLARDEVTPLSDDARQRLEEALAAIDEGRRMVGPTESSRQDDYAIEPGSVPSPAPKE